jgi:hypothetical protein
MILSDNIVNKLFFIVNSVIILDNEKNNSNFILLEL